MQEKKRTGLKVKNNAISPCVLMYRDGGWETTLNRLSDGMELKRSETSRFWYQLPKDISIGDSIRIVTKKEKKRIFLDFQIVSFRKNKFIVEVIDSSDSSSSKKKTEISREIKNKYREVRELEDRYKALVGEIV